jgi:hypothetical protein
MNFCLVESLIQRIVWDEEALKVAYAKTLLALDFKKIKAIRTVCKSWNKSLDEFQKMYKTEITISCRHNAGGTNFFNKFSILVITVDLRKNQDTEFVPELLQAIDNGLEVHLKFHVCWGGTSGSLTREFKLLDSSRNQNLLDKCKSIVCELHLFCSDFEEQAEAIPEVVSDFFSSLSDIKTKYPIDVVSLKIEDYLEDEGVKSLAQNLIFFPRLEKLKLFFQRDNESKFIINDLKHVSQLTVFKTLVGPRFYSLHFVHLHRSVNLLPLMLAKTN